MTVVSLSLNAESQKQPLNTLSLLSPLSNNSFSTMEYIGPLPIWALIVIVVSVFILLVTGILLCLFIKKNVTKSPSQPEAPAQALAQAPAPSLPSPPTTPTPPSRLSSPISPLRNTAGNLPPHLRDVANDQIYANINFEPIA